MKKRILILTALILSGFVFAQNNLPFTKGINMLTFFETWNPYGDKLHHATITEVNISFMKF